jgi:cytochrome c-type biogenesis protein CcmE
VGGLVEIDSLVREGMQVTFMVTDNIKSIKVTYEGILPDLFREGQGVVASGSVSNKCVRWTCANTFIASEILAKHDENYMPPEVAAALEISSSQQ